MSRALKGELKCKDGSMKMFTVESENNLKSIIEGVKKINADISVVLTELVEEEKRGGCRAHEEEEEAEEDEEEDEGEDEDEDAGSKNTAVKLKSEPPVKRLKTITPS